MYNLKVRHIREKPYTRTGDIVIAVNPYQWFDGLYSEDKRCYYSNRLVWENSEEDPRAVMEPHVYEVSALSYKGLAMGEGINQSILVSGESGAGKTETVKICLNHIASVQRGQHPPGYFDNTEYDPVVKRVVQSNPLLEAFGNAKTRRNDNSSRFGKYLQLQFQKNMESKTLVLKSARTGLVGSKCDVYLLEKNRVIAHDSQERTFHIFYQLLASPQKTQFWEGLEGATNSSFKYIGPTNTDTIEGKHDRDHFQDTVNALAVVGVEGQSLDTLMKAMCIVLQLGNLGFSAFCGDTDKSTVSTGKELMVLSALMGVSEKDLELSFTERTFQTASDTYKVNLNPEAAKEACDALAKEAYQKAFLWIVNKINKATCADESNGKQYGFIGLLDIFGFESFPQNRFEQLCINYANEKLQQKFNTDVFMNVQAEYKAEGISLDDIKFDDNTDVLDLIEGRTGLLNLLNEECIRPKGNDMDYVHKALRINQNSPALLVHRTDRLSFGIHHYAGKVYYDAEFFVSKNLDTLPTDLQQCAEQCTNDIINTERLDATPRSSGRGYTRKLSNITAPTVWTKYKNQLASLMSNLHKTKSRYIRCIKPNTQKAPLLMEHTNTIEQLRCAGVVAGITIARSAYPNRLPNSVVLARYSNMWDMEKFPSKKTSEMSTAQKRQCDVQALMECALKSKETVDEDGNVVKAFAVGKTKTFFRSGALELLEAGRMTGLDVHATVIQRAARGWLARNGGRYNNQLRKLEEEMREAARRAEEERKAKLAREAAERRAARLAKHQELVDQVAALEKSYNETHVKLDDKARKVQERNAKARSEMEEMRANFAKMENETRTKYLSKVAAQEKRLQDATKLIAMLKKENRKERKKMAKVKYDYDRIKGINDRLLRDHNGTMEGIDSEGKGEARAYKSRMSWQDQLAHAKDQHAKLKDLVSKRQQQYLAMANARLQLQKNMASALSSIQSKSRDKFIVEGTVAKAVEAETCYKNVTAALDMATFAPDLTGSDVSGSDDSDFY